MANPNINIPEKGIQDFCRRYQIKRMALFGFVLRTDFRPDSDVDVLVVFDPSVCVTFMTFGEMKRGFQVCFSAL